MPGSVFGVESMKAPKLSGPGDWWRADRKDWECRYQYMLAEIAGRMGENVRHEADRQIGLQDDPGDG
jgi:hypothetical protein